MIVYRGDMPRLHVYLPDDLYQIVKERQLPASRLLQEAVRAERHRQAVLEETDRYIAEIIQEVGEPSAEDWAQAEALVRRIRGEEPVSAEG